MSTAASALSKIEAQTKLRELGLKADLANLDATLNDLFSVKAPALKDITTPEELKRLITAVQNGTADNRQITRFISVADRLLTVLV
ncbi:MAG TPA: hypothetical protein VF767_10295 [Bryobacteraceae bacterium]